MTSWEGVGYCWVWGVFIWDLWWVGFQEDLEDLVREYGVFIIQMVVFGEVCINVVPFHCVEVGSFAVVLQDVPCVVNGTK